ncbi:MAG TPA: NAD-dependent epimerase/dehydratase family protein [Casimicrobium sp.]|nr:NAD-dependent epimerase/dehydratase family protein [Casimicrobium sp.]
MKVLVLGGRGFIGRYVVRALIANGVDVSIGTRHAGASSDDSIREREIRLHERTNAEDWQGEAAEYDVIVNCAGILRARWKETFQAVYLDAPIAIATACAKNNTRFIHVTALGLHAAASSGFITAKLAGEIGIAAANPAACIVRPSLLDGIDGFGARWLRRVAQWPVHFVPSDALGRLAPLDVGELGEAIAALSMCDASAVPASVELGGEQSFAMAEYLRALRRNPQPAVQVTVPAWLVRCFAHLFDAFHVTPLSWGHQELMRRDNVPCVADGYALRRWLGRAPSPVALSRLTDKTVSEALPAMRSV